MKVLVGMSGGLDSSVAALNMVEAGHQVEGVFLQLWDPLAGSGSRCCSLEDQEDARRVAAVLGIPLHEACTTRKFFDAVFLASLESYAAGRTPNPCVTCNERIKFSELLALAGEHGADVVATGHYARLEETDGRRRLLRGADRAKDQSYFLHRVSQDVLRRVVFPVGGMTKDEVREVAVGAGLPVAAKPESQELCFVSEGSSYAELLEGWLPGRSRPGAIVSTDGRRLGSHDGVHRFTVGQRRGLGVVADRPLYVVALDAEAGAVVVGTEEELAVRRFGVGDIVWIAGGPPAGSFECTVQVRSRHAGTPARVTVDGGGATVSAREPLRAPAPGQAAVFYHGDELLGGGWIRPPGRWPGTGAP